ncbi:MAG TPA: DUF3788 family protein [Thermoanaerobaculia bacterium]|nr:DUF3788 family protein [Thermoanaerobaculia bacterium]
MALSIFDDKTKPPTDSDVANALGSAAQAWLALKASVIAAHGDMREEWGFTAKSTGWGLRLKQRDRTILYMTPCCEHFLVSFVLGDRAVRAAHERGLPDAILDTLDSARKYAEGRGIRLEVRNAAELPPIEALVAIKVEH